jgi:hypothetical protein
MTRQSKRKHRVLRVMLDDIRARQVLDDLINKVNAAGRKFGLGMARAYAQMRADPEWQERGIRYD